MALISDISTCHKEEFSSQSLICGGEKANIISSLDVSTLVMATILKCNINGLKWGAGEFVSFNSTFRFCRVIISAGHHDHR